MTRRRAMTGLDLKVARIKQGRKQLDLARETGIHPTRLSKIENNWEEPRDDELAAICIALTLSETLTEDVTANAA
jgi:transcriptional regulator with XRE-family HTH domain